MALVKYGGGVIQMSGSMAGNTYARNRFGNYVRARTKPINPNSSRQQAVRAAIAYLTDRWSNTLTAVQRAAWNQYGSNVAMKNKLGETVYLTGFNHYIRSNSILKVQGITLINAGPTVFELPAQDTTFAITASEATQVISAAFDDTMDWIDEDDAYLFVFQGTSQNKQRNFFAGPWRYGEKEEGDSVAAPTSPLAVAAVFPFVEGQRTWCYARIARADGRLSEPFTADCFIAA
jgi:hypothetical protein